MFSNPRWLSGTNSDVSFSSCLISKVGSSVSAAWAAARCPPRSLSSQTPATAVIGIKILLARRGTSSRSENESVFGSCSRSVAIPETEKIHECSKTPHGHNKLSWKTLGIALCNTEHTVLDTFRILTCNSNRSWLCWGVCADWPNTLAPSPFLSPSGRAFSRPTSGRRTAASAPGPGDIRRLRLRPRRRWSDSSMQNVHWIVLKKCSPVFNILLNLTVRLN